MQQKKVLLIVGVLIVGFFFFSYQKTPSMPITGELAARPYDCINKCLGIMSSVVWTKYVPFEIWGEKVLYPTSELTITGCGGMCDECNIIHNGQVVKSYGCDRTPARSLTEF